VPKNVSLKTFEFAIYDAVAVFNVGRKSALDIYKLMNIDPGKYTEYGCQMLNRPCVSKGNLQRDADEMLNSAERSKEPFIRAKLDKHGERRAKIL